MPAPLFAWIGRHAAWLLFAGVLAGLAAPPLAALLWPAVLPVTFLLFVASLLRMDMGLALRHARRPVRAGVIVAALMIGVPLGMAAALRLLPLPETLALSIILMTATSPLLSSPAFALLLGLEAELALVVVLACMSVVPLTMPALALALLGLEIEISPWQLMARLAVFVGAGFIAAGLLRWRIGPERLKSAKAGLDVFNVVLLVIFAVGVMNGVTDRLLADPRHVLLFAASAFLVNMGLQAIGAALFSPAGRSTALTVGLMFGYRNMALPLAVLAGAAPADFALYVAMAQLPMYMLPVLTVRLYRRLLAR